MDISNIIEKANGLPPAPRILPSLNRLLNNPDAAVDEIVDIIRLGPVLSANVIKYANSSDVGQRNPTHSLTEAITIIGIEEAYKIVSTMAMKEISNVSEHSGPYAKEKGQLWKSAIATAISMQLISQKILSNEVDTYTIGLLHNVGKLAIRFAGFSDYDSVYEVMERESYTQAEAENAVYGYDYPEVGGRLLRDWGFPKKLFSAVRFKYNPGESEEPKEYAYQLHVALHIAQELGFTPDTTRFRLNHVDDALNFLYISPEDLEPIKAEVHARVDEVAKKVDL